MNIFLDTKSSMITLCLNCIEKKTDFNILALFLLFVWFIVMCQIYSELPQISTANFFTAVVGISTHLLNAKTVFFYKGRLLRKADLVPVWF